MTAKAPSLPFAPSAVLFDLDGTLVDSERDAADCIDVVLGALGRPLSTEERQFIIGHGWIEIYDYLQRRGAFPLSRAELEHKVFLCRVDLAAARGVTILPGAVELVRRTAARLPCGLVTGSSRDEALLVLRTLGILDCFGAMCCAGEVPRGKPAPDPYLAAATALGVPPAGCVVLEDSTAGIASARAAGMFCIALSVGNFANQDQSQADLILHNLVEVEALLGSAPQAQ